MGYSVAVAQARQKLGEKLAAYRLGAGHKQAEFASLVNFSRSMVANVETGRQGAPAEFWEAADKVLFARGELIAAWEDVEALAQGEHKRKARGLATVPRDPAGGQEGGSRANTEKSRSRDMAGMSPRQCGRCGVRLASANRDSICWPCQRLSRDALNFPPAVSPEFWRADEMKAALAARHMGHIITAYRCHPFHGNRPVPQEAMARWLSISQTQLSRIEKGRPVTDLDRLVQWAQALMIPPALLWFDMPAESPAPQAWMDSRDQDSRDEAEDQPGGEIASAYLMEEEVAEVKRRTFMLATAMLAGIGGADPVQALGLARRSLHEALPATKEADVSEWNEIAWDYGESYLVTPPAELLTSLLSDVAGLRVAFHRYPQPAAQRELCRASALLSAFVAQTASNLGHSMEARNWWRMARTAAERSGDSYAALWVRVRQIGHSLHDRQASAISPLIAEAERLASQAPPVPVLGLLSVKARHLALVGNDAEAKKAVTQFSGRFESSSFGSYSGSQLSWGAERQYGDECSVYARLGRYELFDVAYKAALAAYRSHPENLRWPAEVEMDRAFCLTRNGDITEGVTHARRTVVGLPGAQRAKNFYFLAHDVLNAIPSVDSKKPVVTEYREWLSSAFSSPAALT